MTRLHQVICLLIIVLLANQMSQTKLSKFSECNNKNKQWLEQALSEDVFSTWPLKTRFSSLRDLLFNKTNYWSVIKHQNNERLNRILRKALKGVPVNVIVYGGSNTAGGGLQEDEKSIKERFPIVLQGWWEKAITPVTGSRMYLKTIGIGGTSSSYYQFCYKVYIDKDIDIAILDSSVNDGIAKKFQNSTMNQSLPLEQFTRQLLNEYNNPAVLFVNFFFLKRTWLGCFNLMDRGQSLLPDHYNVTTFDLRNLACDFKRGKFRVTANTTKHQTKDKYHMSLLGHAQAAFMIIQVISKAIRNLLTHNHELKNIHECITVSSSTVFLHQPLPPPIYIKPKSSIIEDPLCWTGLTPDHKKYTIRNSLNVSVLKTKGFTYIDHVPILSPSHHGKAYRTDSFSCWLGKKKDSEITFSFSIPATATKFSIVSMITRSSHDSGELEVWLDKKLEGVRIYPKNTSRQTVVVSVATGVKPGNHTMTVRITKDGNIPVAGIAVGT